MGARRIDYERHAPPHSFIHVDDFESVTDLAEYLNVLDKNDELYNEYFDWKLHWEPTFYHYYCRLCAMLHSDYGKRWYDNIEGWWRGDGVCVEATPNNNYASWRVAGLE